MPSWNEQPFTVLSINVNLTKCTCNHPSVKPDMHFAECPSRPVLIPCRIPRSVTFTVTLGMCDYPRDACRFGHLDGCRARPIRVACSIGGKTWEESHINDCEVAGEGIGLNTTAEHLIAQERWALVKALVLRNENAAQLNTHGLALSKQRDAVFAALADMARMERAYYDAAQAIHKALPGIYVSSDMQACDPDEAPSARWLSSYVEGLIEQVGVVS